MKAIKTLVLVVSIFGITFGPLETWAKLSKAEDISCVAGNAGGGAIALKGTLAMEVTSGLDIPSGNQDVDVTVRLARGGFAPTPFFRLHLVVNAVEANSNEGLACLIFGSPLQGGNTAFGNQIVFAFGLQGRTIFITDSSITDTDFRGPTQNIPGTTHSSSLADITIYAR